MQQLRQTLTVMEAGFKIRPGQEEEFLAAQGRMVPVAMKQPGFVSVYGGPIVGSDWLYFGVRFDTPAKMDDWHNDPRHTAMQRPAREKWWTAVYIRKWRRPEGDDAFGDRVFAETRICRQTPLTATETQRIRNLLGALTRYEAKPFETLTGEFEPQPYQLVGPMEIAPSMAPSEYSILSHWSSRDALSRWEEGPEAAELASFGDTTTEAFVPIAEPNARLGLRQDRLQRDWTLDGRHPAAVVEG